ncbi:MAG: hypothetical protein MRZ79_10475 [Bacteroidia bacterium]|nr:hypothetical protein [Bacteroidia bacterium]
MEKVLILENLKTDADLISGMLSSNYQHFQTQIVISRFLKGSLSTIKKQHPKPEFIFVNLDSRDESLDLNLEIQSLRQLYKDAFILVWTNPLSPLPAWETSYGKGAFAFKPVEMEKLNQMINFFLKGNTKP